MLGSINHKPEASHRHQCWRCHKGWFGYGSHYGNRAICTDDPITLCCSCLAKEFPNVTMRISEAYREIRAGLIAEAEEYADRKVGTHDLASTNNVEWTKVFLRRMSDLALDV